MADCHNNVHPLNVDIHGGVHTANRETEVMHSTMKMDLPNVGAANVSRKDSDSVVDPLFV